MDDFERAVEESDQLFDELQTKRPDKNYGLGAVPLHSATSSSLEPWSSLPAWAPIEGCN